ncbi:MAG: ArnT family glycosyltransferase, partial [Anaerolineales bacterium]
MAQPKVEVEEQIALSDLPSRLILRRLPSYISLAMGLLAFLTFGGNRFTPLNLTFWGLSLAFYFKALWVWHGGECLSRIKALLAAPQWTFSLRREHLWLFLALVIAIFFRLYRLDGVPAEPFSDHAEKILDVYDITQGHWSIFFPRNTGREGLQMYWTVLIAKLFGGGLSFFSLKLGTALLGIFTLPYLYLLGKEIGNPRIGLLAMFLGGIAFWPNIISRIGLRFPLYPLFTVITLYYLLRGLRSGSRNDFLLSGLFLGIGLHGYTPFRIVPFLVVIAMGLYMLHIRQQAARRTAWLGLILIALTALLVFLPLLRYALENPQQFGYRALSRLTAQEAAIPGFWLWVFLHNVWRALLMFHWDEGNIWVVSIPHRPALDLVGGVFFVFGLIFLLWRYGRHRQWQDLFLLLAIPLLQLPSTLSLAFPDENPAPNRAGGVYVVVFLVVALGFDVFLRRLEAQGGKKLAQGVSLILLLLALGQNYSLTFQAFDRQYRLGTWNSSEMGAVLKQFFLIGGTPESAWIVPYPHWVDTRLPGVWAGIPNRDFALWPDQLEQSLAVPA